MNRFDLTGKKAIVTGGTAGLGRGMVEALHEAGAEVLIIDIADKVFETAKEVGKEGPSVYAIKGDLSDRKQILELFNKSIETLGTVDILINNAGIQRVHDAEDFPEDVWDKVIEINLNSVFKLCQLVGKVMLKKGSGKIINIASMNTFVTAQKIPAYVATKGAIGQITKALANEWGGRGVNVNAIAPGYMDTALTSFVHKDKERLELINSRIPKGRWGTPEDMKGVAVFLSARASDYINGVIIPVDGGYLSR